MSRDIVWHEIPGIFGSGGGMGGGKGKNGDKSDKNTLRSNSIVRMLDALCEGEVMLENGAKSIYFGDVPLMNDDGTYNFQGVSWAFANGYPDQHTIPGFSSVESVTTYNTQIKKHNPVTVQITDQYADAAVVTLQLPALFQKANEKTALKKVGVQLRVDCRYNDGPWLAVAPSANRMVDIYGKCTSPYERSLYFQLPKAPTGISYPWEIRVVRISNDSNDQNDNQIDDSMESDSDAIVANETYLVSVTSIQELKLSYPNTALIGAVFNAEYFGSSIPTRSYIVKRMNVQIPSNYDPDTRVYSGIWDGTFKTGNCNGNPAWAIWDLLTNNIFGIGDMLDVDAIDKWSLYSIAQYCDEMIPDGFGGFEPRFTLNCSIGSSKDIIELIQTLSSAYRGMAYYAGGSIMSVQDRPKEPMMLVNQTNVIDGNFIYSCSDLRTRHTVVNVGWLDPENHYKLQTEVVEDAEMIKKYGYRSTDVQAIGCTSRGQARRLGMWIIETDCRETETLTYRTGLDHAIVSPGDVVAVHDPSIAGVRWGGRIVGINSRSEVVIDKELTDYDANEVLTISIAKPDGKFESKTISSIDGTILTLASNLSFDPFEGSMWIVTSADLDTRKFRVISKKEVDDISYEITSLVVDETKYARIDYGIHFEDTPITKIPYGITKPRNLTAIERHYYDNGKTHAKIILSWTAPSDSAPEKYHIVYESPDGNVDWGYTSGVSIEIDDTIEGDYTFGVSSVSASGKQSDFATVSLSASGWAGTAAPYVTNLQLVGGVTDTVFSGKSPKISWKVVFPDFPDIPLANIPFYAYNTVSVYDTETNQLLGTHVVIGESFIYEFSDNFNESNGLNLTPCRSLRFEVSVSDTLSRTSAVKVLSVNNPAPAMIFPTTTPNWSYVNVTWPSPSDRDYVACLIWVSDDPEFEVTGMTPTIDSKSGAVIDLEAGVHYMRIAAYDEFGKYNLNVSGVIEISTADPIDFSKISPSLDKIWKGLQDQADINTETILGLVLKSADDAKKNDEKVARVSTQITTIAGSLAQRIDQLEVANGEGAAALIQIEATARIDADAALATQITSLGAAMDDNSAAITAEMQARATADSALAASIQTIQANTTNYNAGGSIIWMAAADQSGALARYELHCTTEQNGSGQVADAAMIVEAISAGNLNLTQMKFKADRFYIMAQDGSSVTPFAVVDGRVFIDDLQIRHTLQIGDAYTPNGRIVIMGP